MPEAQPSTPALPDHPGWRTVLAALPDHPGWRTVLDALPDHDGWRTVLDALVRVEAALAAHPTPTGGER